MTLMDRVLKVTAPNQVFFAKRGVLEEDLYYDDGLHLSPAGKEALAGCFMRFVHRFQGEY